MLRKILLLFTLCSLLFAPVAWAAVRDANTINRSASVSASRTVTLPSVRGAVVNRATTTMRNATQSRSATNVVRNPQSEIRNSARGATQSRSATNVVRNPQSEIRNSARSATRATAIYDDLSKMGAGYSNCSNAYNTCMDQFCAKSNDTYRRCFCSDKITEFRTREAGFDEARRMLAQFEDTNLNAVDKSSAEVASMYSSTIGEDAIRRDVNGAQSILDGIDDILSGKTETATSSSTSTSLLFDVDDIWNNSSSSRGLFDMNADEDIGTEGVKLYNSADEQCQSVMRGSCDNSASETMARSAYNVLITQDCNAYEKSIDAKQRAVEETVRQAEQMLRDARLEDYRTHNSADVNECIDRVKTEITKDTACGANYIKCLDLGTGQFFSASSGEALPNAPWLELTDMINLTGATGDNLLAQNRQYDTFIETYKNRVVGALDTCRDISDTVWMEFKRTALIEISQAQDAKVEEVKNECITTMTECYDNQTGQMRELTGIAAEQSGAISAYTARELCSERVDNCVAVYGNMDALRSFVSSVDDFKIAAGCEEALVVAANDLCTPATGGGAYPENCTRLSKVEIEQTLTQRAQTYCKNPTTGEIDTTVVGATIEKIIADVQDSVGFVLENTCVELGGIWFVPDAENTAVETYEDLPDYKSRVFGGATPSADMGQCKRYTAGMQCNDEGVSCNLQTGVITLSDAWYKDKCENSVGGHWDTELSACMYTQTVLDFVYSLFSGTISMVSSVVNLGSTFTDIIGGGNTVAGANNSFSNATSNTGTVLSN